MKLNIKELIKEERDENPQVQATMLRMVDILNSNLNVPFSLLRMKKYLGEEKDSSLYEKSERIFYRAWKLLLENYPNGRIIDGDRLLSTYNRSRYDPNAEGTITKIGFDLR